MNIGAIRRDVLAAPMSFRYVMGEVRELLEEAVRLNPKGMREEWGDVVVCGLCWAARGLPVLDKVRLHGAGLESTRKFIGRLDAWKEIFSEAGYLFDRKYLVGGGNYRKPEKVRAALEMAHADQKQ